MLNNPARLAEFESASLAADNLSLTQKYRILDGLYEEARHLGHFNQRDMLDGIEDDIRLAALLKRHVPIPDRTNRPRS